MKIHGISVFSKKPIEIKIDNGFISDINSWYDDRQNLPYISPGFFDLQVNGYKGSDYSLKNFSEEHLKNIVNHLVASGTIQHIPTIISSPQNRIMRNLKVISKAINSSTDIRNTIPGVHIEGPFISPEDGPRGCHDSSFIRNPNYKEFEK